MYEYKCKVIRVVDGDTVDVDIDLGFGVWLHKERVRIIGMDTPESRTRDKEEKKYGLAAKAELKVLLDDDDIKLVTKENPKIVFGEEGTERGSANKTWQEQISEEDVA